MEINKNFSYNFIVLLIGLVISLPILIIFLNIFELSVNDIIDFVSTNFSDIISIRIAFGSGVAFFIAQNLDVQIFDSLRKKICMWLLSHHQ